MKMLFFILLQLTCIFSLYGKDTCHVKLLDAYNFDRIQLDSTFYFSNVGYVIDAKANVVKIYKVKGKNFSIWSSSYQLLEQDLNLRKIKRDTITLNLLPHDDVLKARYEKLWKNETPDTLKFENEQTIRKMLKSYFYCLKKVVASCDESLCQHDNIFQYDVFFKSTNGVFAIHKIEQIQGDNFCMNLNEHIRKLSKIFPKFRYHAETEMSKIRFIVSN